MTSLGEDATMFRTKIIGTGHYLPENKITNHDLAKMVDTNHEWIVERTGIHARRNANDNQSTTDLALIAATNALEMAQLDAKDLDMIVFCSITPDYIMPSSACILQEKLGASNCVSFDLVAACSGFIYGLATADMYIKTGVKKNILVIGAEVLHNFVDYTDRGTCILFGDAAGAAVVTRNEDESDNAEIYSHHMYSDGSLNKLLYVPSGGSQNPATKESFENKEHFVKMNGREIFKHAVRAMSKCSSEAIETNNMSLEDISWVVPHQANTRIIEATAKHLGISMDKVIVEIEEMGNTSAATIPVALDIAVRDQRIQRGQNVLLTAFGAGLTSGSLLFNF